MVVIHDQYLFHRAVFHCVSYKTCSGIFGLPPALNNEWLPGRIGDLQAWVADDGRWPNEAAPEVFCRWDHSDLKLCIEPGHQAHESDSSVMEQ